MKVKLITNTKFHTIISCTKDEEDCICNEYQNLMALCPIWWSRYVPFDGRPLPNPSPNLTVYKKRMYQ
jgi:hypothetical protein